MNLSELLQIKFPDANFTSDILLRDQGNGIEIQAWNLPVPKPSTKDINNWKQELELKYRQQLVEEQRKSLYPSVEKQLDMQYWDGINNTTVWEDTISSIKEQYPMPTE